MRIVVDTYAWAQKADLSSSQLEGLRTALTVTPRKVGDHPGEAPGPISLFSENAAVFGMPRQFFLGRRKPGHEVEFRTIEGDKTNWPGDLKFVGTLREEQARGRVHVVGMLKGGSLGGMVRAVPGWGKCLGIGTPVLLFDGRILPVEELKTGDVLMGPDSLPRRILSTIKGTGPLYRIVPKIGKPWVCNDVHILTLVHSVTDEVQDIPLQDWLRLSATGRQKPYLKQFSPENGVEFTKSSPLPVDPYFLGVWFGDGSKKLFAKSAGAANTTKDAEIEALCRDTAKHYGLHVRVDLPVHLKHPCPTYHLAGERGGARNPLLDLLREAVGEGEALPRAYLCASREDREKFLAGWLDTDGYHNNGCYEITQKRHQWAEDIAFLARSLGIRATIRQKDVPAGAATGSGGTYWRVKLAGNFGSLPLRIARKLPRERLQKKVATRTSFHVESLGEGDYAGFTLDGDGRFLLGDFTVTHNTVWTCAVMAELQVPTLVVVHKEFLMDQWRQRIQEYLPGAQIGIAQGPDLDFKGKHVVLGMVHSLCDKDYGEEFRRYFGLVVTDEVHRIGSETWSRVPPLFPARWRLGLSATPRRKDGADAVFHHHIGEVIFSSKEVRMKPKVRKVWITPDLFKIVHTPNFNPSLIKKGLLLRFMCISAGRNRVIVEQIVQAVKAGRKCLVLSERLQHLRDMETLLYKNWGDVGDKPSVGFYIGGQEQEALNEAAKAQVIFATSQLVQEGLDIPPLDTIFLTCPMGDVEQAIGRVLRPFEGKKEPIVVDFRDDHIGLCKRYGEFRDKFYKKQEWAP